MSFAELKRRQSAMWGSGPFENVADTIADVHDTLIERLCPQPGERWLDLACGTGAVAERLARAGAVVTGVDFAAPLVETARRRAAEAGLEIQYEVGDAEELRFDDGAFDGVASTFGIMFAPDQEAAAAELARVVHPGGRIGLATWPPGGMIARLFALLGTFQPPPPPDAGSPLAWGDEEHVRRLLGDAFHLTFEQALSILDEDSAEESWELFSTSFGPLRTLAGMLDDERRKELRRAYVEFSERESTEPGRLHHEREYLVVLGTRR
jgi:ubiquinone/menaquinone biosynthesis C-methylase UbiE